jgi:hypothetical protein
MVLDIVGDLLSKLAGFSISQKPLTPSTVLYLPISIIWRIRVPPAQKVALLLSLGLTALIVIITIVRFSGFVKDGVVDTIWGAYWLVLGAEIAIFMAAAIAFRAFFVARGQSKASTPPVSGDKFFRSSLARKFRRRGAETELDSADEKGLPSIPGAQLTGMRTMIDQQGRSPIEANQHSNGFWPLSDEEDAIPLRSYATSGK